MASYYARRAAVTNGKAGGQCSAQSTPAGGHEAPASCADAALAISDTGCAPATVAAAPAGDGSCQEGPATYYVPFVSHRRPPRWHPPQRNQELNQRLMGAASFEEVLAIADESLSEFDGCNLSTALNRCAKTLLGVSTADAAAPAGVLAAAARDAARADLRMQRLEDAACRRLPLMFPRQVANMLWSRARLGVGPEDELVARAGREVEKRFASFRPLDLSLVAWAFGTLRKKDAAALSAVSAQTVEKIEEFRPQELANILWGIASVQFRHARIFGLAAAAVLAKRELYKQQELANVLWAFASLGYRDEHPCCTATLFAQVGSTIVDRLSEFDPQSLTNVLWSYATLRHREDKLFAAAGQYSAEQLHTFKPQEIANILWAYRSLAYRHDKLLDAVCGVCSRSEALQAWSGEQLMKLDQFLQDFAPSSHAATEAVAALDGGHLAPVRDFLASEALTVPRSQYLARMYGFKLYNLGAHTLRAAAALGLEVLGSEDEFRGEAQRRLLEYYVGPPKGNDPRPVDNEPWMVFGGQTTSRWVACVLEYDLEVDSAAGRWCSCTGQRVVPAPAGRGIGEGLKASRAAPCSEASPLWTVPLTASDRAGHCEVAALASMMAEAAAASPPAAAALAARQPSRQVRGRARLFAAHTPCLSCLGAAAQLARLWPEVHLAIGFDDWPKWQERMQLALGPDWVPPTPSFAV